MGAFEKPIIADEDHAISTLSARALAGRLSFLDKEYDFKPEVSYVLAGNEAVREELKDTGEAAGLGVLVDRIREHAVSALGDPA